MFKFRKEITSILLIVFLTVSGASQNENGDVIKSESKTEKQKTKKKIYRRMGQ